MTLINSQIIYNWPNEETDTQAQKLVCLHLKEQLADPTSKIALRQQKIKNYSCLRSLQVPNDVRFNLHGNIFITKNEQRRCQNKPCTARPRTFWKNARLL